VKQKIKEQCAYNLFIAENAHIACKRTK